MESYKEECIHKSETINKLQKRISELEGILREKNKEIKMCVKRMQDSDNELAPVKKSLNSMTAEHGKLLRKLKRKENKQ